MQLEMPKLLDIPAKLLRIVDQFDKYRYFLAEGGRGGGKSQAVARLILYLLEHYNLRVVCGREIQKNIEESVYTIIVDIIRQLNLDFEIWADKITHKTSGGSIRFKGFREQGSVNIKGLEGVDILWIDEAQAITKHTLEVIIPTIRKEKSKVFFTMNRHLKSDPVYREFHDREDCLHINIGYQDNPFCSDALRKEAEICRERNPDDYAHIWGGQPLEDADNYLFVQQKTDLCKTVDFLGCGYHEVAMGVDIARYGGDKSVATILQRRGPIKWEVKHVERWSKRDLMESTGRVIDLQSRFKPASTAIDADGIGAGVVDRMTELKANVKEFHGGPGDEVTNKVLWGNLRTEWYCKLQELIAMERLGCKFDTTLESLLTIMYTHKSSGQKILITKEQMRTKGIHSPDDADSLMMALYATSFMDRKLEDNEDYRTPMKRAAHSNPFKIAGFR